MLLKLPVERSARSERIGWVAVEIVNPVEGGMGAVLYRVTLLGKDLPRPESEMVSDLYKVTDLFNRFGCHEMPREDLPLIAGWPYLTDRYRELLSEGW